MFDFGTPRAYYHPTDAAGGNSGDSLTDPGAGIGDGSDAGQVGGDGGDGGQVEDDYADLAGDERVQAYLAKQYGHIPEEHRSPEGFQALLGAKQQVGTLQQQLQALQQQGQQGGGQQQQTKAEEKAFHAAILQELEGEMGTQLKPDQKRFFGGMLDRAFKAMTAHVEKTYFGPVQQYLINQRLQTEQREAEAKPGYRENEQEIRNIVAQSNGTVSFDQAYKIVMYDKQQTKQQKQAGGSIAALAASGTSGGAKQRPVVDGDRPSGASASARKMPKYKSPEAATAGAAADLRRMGIGVVR